MSKLDVAIVGGGPVGLLLGCLLLQEGIEARVFERRHERGKHSRAVGVHPPGLDCLAAVGVADPLLDDAVRVRHAFAFDDTRALGTVDFACLPAPYQFVLTVPQTTTEALLERRLRALSDRAFVSGAQVTSCNEGRDDVTLLVQGEQPVHARYVISCEGKHSLVRSHAGIAFRGAPYAANFMMADTRDDTPFGAAAAIFLAREGLVESFPMPGGMRRWVVALGGAARAPDQQVVQDVVRQRTGQRAPASSATMVSAFCAERYLADRFVAGRMVLAGDAAHVLSPIGGQGMNLGWLDVMMLAELLPKVLAGRSSLARYEERRAVAKRAIRRAEAFMAIAQERPHARALAALAVRALLSDPLKKRAAKLFTMHGLS